MNNQMNAAYGLVGQTLKNGWIVTQLVTKPPQGTGGFFSVCYIVENNGQTAFLKALNFVAFFTMMPGRSIMAIMQEQSNAYEYEKEVLNRCKNNNLSKVATIIDEGEIIVPGFVISQVPYLIFEMADGDLRRRLINFSDGLEISWKLRSLHNIAVGIQQLHSVKISHQDLKPSNVLVYDNGNTSKVGDLGRALCQDITAPHDVNGSFTGDSNYAPPEVLYGYLEPNWQKRMQQVDLYMFGSLIAFYFSGATLTGLIFDNLDVRFHFQLWRGNYDDVKGYLSDAYYKAIDILRADMNSPYTKELLLLVESCTNINPLKRGLHHKREVSLALPFEPVISKLDLLSRKAEREIRN